MMKADIRILVVDDDISSQDLLKHHLLSAGFTNIVSTMEVDSALKILKSDKIDLIITDRYMPGKNGLDLFKSIKEDKTLRSIPFLMMTSENEKDKVIEALQIGIRNYIIKPVYADTLKEKINGLLKLE